MIFVAIILGIIEGITEFLPVSSTGHLILAGHALGFTGTTANTFEIFIQLGAILAVIVLYRERFYKLLDLSAQGFAGRHGLWLLFLTTLPALIAGFLFHGYIKEVLFNPLSVAVGLLLGGVALIAVEYLPKRVSETQLDNVSRTQALKIGLFQILALVPGVSRAGATIVGGRLMGLDRRTSVEYSFLAAVPVIVAAVTYDLYKNLPSLQADDAGIFLTGFLAAFLSAMLAIKVFVKFLEKYSLAVFGWYRIALAILILFALFVF